MDGRTKAIIAHITVIGWIVAIVLNSQERDEITAFYIRQTLGIWVFMLLTFLPGIRWIVYAIGFILWIISLLNAVAGSDKPVPLIGEYFQDWFKGI